MKNRFKKIIQISFILFLLFVLASFFIWKKNLFSKASLKFEILCPEKADILEEVECNIRYKNNSDFRLEEPQLLLLFPEGTLEDGKIVESKKFSIPELGEAIYPGSEKNIPIKLSFLGKEGERKIVKGILTYRPKNLKATYESSSEALILLQNSPLNLDFDLSSKSPIGTDTSFKVSYYWNFNQPATDFRIQLDYPDSFEFENSTPKGLDNKEWSISLINPFQGGKIEIFGKLHGDVGSVQIFNVKAGFIKDGKFFVLKEEKKGTELVKPLVLIRQEINGNPSYKAMAGDWLHYEIYFKNIGEEELTNLTLISKLEGEAFDFTTLKTNLGIFHPEDNSIIFDWRKVDQLVSLPPTKEGKVEFWIKLKDDLSKAQDLNLKNVVFLGEAREEFVTKISSFPELVQKVFFEDEVFGNNGAFPFKANLPTTLTLIWQVKNYSSDLKDVRVKVNLPSWTKLTGKFFPEEAASQIIFDTNTRELNWIVGDVKKGTGIVEKGPSIAFQVEILPQENQKGQSIEIISGGKLEAFDLWLETKIQQDIPPLKTSDLSDFNFSPSQGIIQ